MIASGIFGLGTSSQAGLIAHYAFDEAASATLAVDQLGGTCPSSGSEFAFVD